MKFSVSNNKTDGMFIFILVSKTLMINAYQLDRERDCVC
jgi:hypothetical protein